MPNALSECTIPLVLKKIGKDKLTGCLTVTVEGGSRQLIFEKGVLRFASTDDPDLRLGAILVATGSISPTDLSLFDPILRVRCNEPIGSVLADLGLISTPILHQALLAQMVRIVADLFPRSAGEWDFEATQTALKDPNTPGLEVAALMMEGVRAIKDFSFYKRTFAAMFPKPCQELTSTSVVLTSVQRKFITKVGRMYPTTNADMPVRMNMNEDLYWRAILLFFLLERIEFVDQSETEVEFDLEDTLVIQMEQVDRQIRAAAAGAALRGGPEAPPLEMEMESGSVDQEPAQPESVAPDREIVVVQETSKPAAAADDKAPEDPESCFELAEQEFSRRNFFKALSLIETALRRGPARPKYYQLLGRIQMQFPKLRRDAENSFLKQAEMEPWNADPYYYMGELYQLEGFHLRAEKQFQKALELNMDHTKAGIRMNQINPALFRATAGQRKGKK